MPENPGAPGIDSGRVNDVQITLGARELPLRSPRLYMRTSIYVLVPNFSRVSLWCLSLFAESES
jgi:hypothetical protein